jgi:hypothetical protein
MSAQSELDLGIATLTTYREDYGKGHRYYIDGARVPGCTTILNSGFPKQMAKWGAEQAAAKAINNWNKLGRMPISQRLKELEKAPWEDMDRAGIKGTRVHKLAEALLNGEAVSVPADLAGYVKAARKFLTDWKVQPVLVEAPVFSRKHQYGATLDLLALLADDQSWLIDWKTNRSGPFGDVAFQLAASRYADFMMSDDGSEQPLPEINQCGVVWLRDGEYVFYPYEVSRKTFRQFIAIKGTSEAVEDSKFYRGDPVMPPVQL